MYVPSKVTPSISTIPREWSILRIPALEVTFHFWYAFPLEAIFPTMLLSVVYAAIPLSSLSSISIVTYKSWSVPW